MLSSRIIRHSYSGYYHRDGTGVVAQRLIRVIRVFRGGSRKSVASQ
jgi:hypothetical protein